MARDVDPQLRAVAEAALDVARERDALLTDIRRALVLGEQDCALRLMRRYCGLEEEGDENEDARGRTGQGLH